MPGFDAAYVVRLVVLTVTVLGTLLFAPSSPRESAQPPYYEFYALAVSRDTRNSSPVCSSGGAGTVQSGKAFLLVFCWRVYQLSADTIVHHDYAIRAQVDGDPTRTVYSRSADSIQSSALVTMEGQTQRRESAVTVFR